MDEEAMLVAIELEIDSFAAISVSKVWKVEHYTIITQYCVDILCMHVQHSFIKRLHQILYTYTTVKYKFGMYIFV